VRRKRLSLRKRKIILIPQIDGVPDIPVGHGVPDIPSRPEYKKRKGRKFRLSW